MQTFLWASILLAVAFAFSIIIQSEIWYLPVCCCWGGGAAKRFGLVVVCACHAFLAERTLRQREKEREKIWNRSKRKMIIVLCSRVDIAPERKKCTRETRKERDAEQKKTPPSAHIAWNAFYPWENENKCINQVKIYTFSILVKIATAE